MMKRMMSLLLCVLLLASSCLPVGALAAAASSVQITERDADDNPDPSSLEGGKVVINKSIRGTDIENVFDITLEVTTKQHPSDVKVAQDAAVVIVIDSSGSMKDTPTGSTKQRMDIAKEAAEAFIRQFADVGNSGAKRLVAVVDFEAKARHLGYDEDAKSSNFYWLDVTNADSLALLVGDPNKDDGKLADLKQGGNTNIEAGLQLAENLYTTFWNTEKDNDRETTGITSEVFGRIQNKMVILLTDGMPTHYLKTDLADKGSREAFTTDDTAKDNCYANNVYYTTGFSDPLTKTTYIRVPDKNGVERSITHSDVTQAVKQEYSIYRKHAAYPGTESAKTVATSLMENSISVFGVPVDIPEIYVEKPHDKINGGHLSEQSNGKQQQHWTIEKNNNDYYTYYSDTADGKGRKGAAKWMSEWCTDAFNATTDLNSILSGFTKAFSQGTTPLLVTDTLPDYVELLDQKNASEKHASWTGSSLRWDLKEDTPIRTEGRGENKTYTYSYTYTVALNTTADTYRAEIIKNIEEEKEETGEVNIDETKIGADTNVNAAVHYVLSDSTGKTTSGDGEFEHPKVRADYSGLTFVKTDKLTEAALSGVGFSLAGTATGSGKPWSQTVTSAADGAVAFANIPAGTYTLTETSAPEGYQQMNPVELTVSYGNVASIREIMGADDNAENRPADDPQDILQIDLPLGEGSSYGLLNDRQTGTLTISKEEGPSVVETAIDRDKEFGFSVELKTQAVYGTGEYNVPLANKTYTIRRNEVNAETPETITTDEYGAASFNLHLDDSIEILGLPVGTQFRITETVAENYDLTKINLTENPTENSFTGLLLLENNVETRDLDEAEPVVEFTNTRKTGSVKVSKETIGTSHAPNKQFPFQLTVYGDGEYQGAELVTDQAKSYKASGSIQQVPSGTRGIAFSAEEQQEGQPLKYTANFSLAKGEVAVFDKLPVGFKYELKEVMTEEQADDYLSDQPENGYTGTIAADAADQDEAPVVHAFTNIRRTGSLIIRKQVEGNGAAKDQLFTYEITLDDRTIHTVPGVEGVPVNGEDITATLYKGSEETGTELKDFLFNQGVARVELAHDQYVVIDHLPTETQIEVRELSDAEMRGEAETPDGQNEGVKTEEELEAERREEEEKKKDPNYGKLGYADYEVWVKTIANGVSSDAPSAVATGAVYEDAEDVIPLTVLYTNIRRVGDLTIQKKVAEAGDYKGIFDFTLTVTSDRVRPDQINGWYGDLWFKDGVSQFKLGHLQSVTAKELPAGAQYSVVEDSQGHNQSAEGLEGVIVEGGQVWVSITNWLPFLPETGDDSRLGLMLAVFACSVAGLALFAMRRRRSRSNG